MAWILVLDDEPAVRDALVAQLEAMEHRCTQAQNGVEGLEHLHAREYDLVITDVMMPRMNGFQFMRRVLPYLDGRVPVIVLSSVDDPAGIAAALHAGAFDYLNKPTEMAAARRVIRKALEKRAEMVRLRGRWSGRGGPVPAEALGPAKEDLREAAENQRPAGVPAFREEHAVVSVAPPRSATPAATEAPAPRGLWARLKRVFGGSADAA